MSWVNIGGHGEPIRKSNVEHKNIISFVLYVEHYHEKDLRDQRRDEDAADAKKKTKNKAPSGFYMLLKRPSPTPYRGPPTYQA